MDLASVVAALASVGVRVSGSNPNNNIQGDSSRACPTGLAGPEPSGTHIDPGQHFQGIVLPLARRRRICKGECLPLACPAHARRTTCALSILSPQLFHCISALGDRNCIACKVHLDVFHASATPPCPSSWSGPSRLYPYFDKQRGVGGAMRQRILGSHTPPCHRRMVITT